jgi:hypothetical protein
MDTKPTPRPWNWSPSKSDFSYIQVGLTAVVARTTPLDKCNGKANAAHIVKCVNMHDELVRLSQQILKLCKGRESLSKVEIEVIEQELTKILAKVEGRDE